jgi:hypothetical protein
VGKYGHQFKSMVHKINAGLDPFVLHQHRENNTMLSFGYAETLLKKQVQQNEKLLDLQTKNYNMFIEMRSVMLY